MAGWLSGSRKWMKLEGQYNINMGDFDEHTNIRFEEEL